MDNQPGSGSGLIFLLRIPDGLKVRTRLAEIGVSTPLFGFRPTRSRLDLTSNTPKPVSLTGSPCSSVAAISCRTISTSAADAVLDKPTWLYTASARSAPCNVFGSKSARGGRH